MAPKSDHKRAVNAWRRLRPKQRIGLAVAAIVLVLVLGLLMVMVPGFQQTLYNALGIRESQAYVAAQVDTDTKVHIIDVLQGDAVLLEQNGEYALIDAGPPEGQDNLLAYLDGIGVEKLRYLFLTHPHADHLGGMQAVVERYDVALMVLPDLAKAPYPTTRTFLNLLEALVQGDVPTETAQEAAVYPLGGGTITVLQNGLATEDNYNLLSLCLLFEAQGFRFFNTGDAEKANEKALLESGFSFEADVFMAGHHGSSTSNTSDFLAAIRPQIVVISLAADNSYGHPHRSALDSFEEQAALVLRTDENGTVVLGPDGNGGVVYAVAAGAEDAAA